MFKGFAEFRSSRILAIATVVVAIFVDVFVYGIVILILPSILSKRLHVPSTDVQYWLSVLLATYNAAVVICAPIFGYVADRLPNKKVFMLGGLLALAICTAAFAAAPTLPWLVVARVLQGISAAIVWAVGLALLVEVVGHADMGFAMGWVTIAISLGATGGPFVGGIAYESVGHYGTFAIAGAIIVVDMILRLLFVQPKLAHSRLDEDSAASRSKSQGSQSGDIDENTSSANGDADEETGLLNKQRHKKVTESRIPTIIRLMANPEMLFSLWCIFAVNAVQIGFEAVLPLHIQKTFLWSTRGTGLMYLTLLIPVLLGPVVGRLYDRIGHVPLAIAGVLAIAAGTGILSGIHDSETRDIVIFAASLLVVGLGITLVLTPEFAEVSAFAEKKEAESPGCFGPSGATAQCCALITICVALAGVVGPSALGAVQTLHGWTATCLTCSGMVASALVVLLATRVLGRRSSASSV